MSDKKPQAGEWWFSNGTKDRWLCHGLNREGVPIIEDESGAVFVSHGVSFTWHHEPRCTGWEWQPEPEPDEWVTITDANHIARRDIDHIRLWNEKIEPVIGLAGMPKRKILNELVCRRRDLPPHPAEDPDEWVTQDRVPYRKGVDEFRWMRVFGTPFSEWSNMETNPRMHGYIDGLNSRFEVRCRRRDLPQIPEPKPATQREVLLYWYDGNVVGRYADCPPTDPSFTPLIIRDGKAFIETKTREV